MEIVKTGYFIILMECDYLLPAIYIRKMVIKIASIRKLVCI